MPRNITGLQIIVVLFASWTPLWLPPVMQEGGDLRIPRCKRRGRAQLCAARDNLPFSTADFSVCGAWGCAFRRHRSHADARLLSSQHHRFMLKAMLASTSVASEKLTPSDTRN